MGRLGSGREQQPGRLRQNLQKLNPFNRKKTPPEPPLR